MQLEASSQLISLMPFFFITRTFSSCGSSDPNPDQLKIEPAQHHRNMSGVWRLMSVDLISCQSLSHGGGCCQTGHQSTCLKSRPDHRFQAQWRETLGPVQQNAPLTPVHDEAASWDFTVVSTATACKAEQQKVSILNSDKNIQLLLSHARDRENLIYCTSVSQDSSSSTNHILVQQWCHSFYFYFICS